MTENPYRLARDIRGIGFKTADAIAMKLGIEKTAIIRVRAGISYALTDAMDEGHCGLPTEDLIPLAEKLLEVPQELIHTALDLELREGTALLASARPPSSPSCASQRGLLVRTGEVWWPSLQGCAEWRQQALKPRPSIGSWKSTQQAAALSAVTTTRSTVTCWLSTKPQWSMSC
jgi:hypothetical protein